jgi:F-type H+-transporting ATPase subunit c
VDSGTIVTVVTIVCVAVAIVAGTLGSTVMQGRAVIAALEGMSRQPEMADRLRATLFISLALLETASIYALLICLILIFANPMANLLF